MVGEHYIKNIIAHVLPTIGKELSMLQAELIWEEDNAAQEIYCDYIEAGERVIREFMEHKRQELSEIRKALEV